MQIGVVGQGVMGKGIVQLLAQSEAISSIIWVGRSTTNGENSLRALGEQWAKMVERKRLSTDLSAGYLRKISITGEYRDLSAAIGIIEAVTEDITVKRSVFKNIAKVAHKDAIVASNTSSLSITDLGSSTAYPGNVIGLHFFNPATIMKLTEVVVGMATAASTIEWACGFARSLGKEPVIVNEAPGFVVNRMLIPMINEAIGILAEGVATAEEIDRAMRLGANHPIGPLALADLIGNDVSLSIMETLHSETGDSKYRAHPLLRKMVRAKYLGRKTGVGFFKY